MSAEAKSKPGDGPIENNGTAAAATFTNRQIGQTVECSKCYGRSCGLKCKLDGLKNAKNMGSSSARKGFLLNADHTVVQEEADAAYIYYPEMSAHEIAKYQMYSKKGIRVPTLVALPAGGAIVQFVHNRKTIAGFSISGKSKSPFDDMTAERALVALQDITRLVDNNYSELDLQMMLDKATGNIYVMDFEDVGDEDEDEDEDDGLMKTLDKLKILQSQLKKKLGMT